MTRRREGGPGASLQANRYDPKTGTLVWTAGQVSAFEEIHEHFGELVYNRKVSGEGLKPGMITDAEDTRAITAFIAWTAWTGVARRPGKTYSYTNNWPPEELVGNTLTGDAIMWSTLSLVTLLGGSGLVLGLYGRHSRVVGWHETEERQVRFVPPSSVALTPAQRVTAWFFLVVAALFLLQNLVGGATVHYMVEAGGFFGIDLPKWLPYNLTRTWHLQMAIFFVATAYLAAGIFLAPLIAGREPRGQGVLSALLLGALAVVVFGSLGGEYLSYHGLLPRGLRSFFGAQGWEYLELGRFWMYLLIVGMVLWVVIIYRGLLAPPGRREPGQPALAVPLQLAVDPGLLRGRPADPHAVPVRDRRLLAVLGRPPLGRRLPGAVHDDAGGLDLRADGHRLGAVRHAADLLRRDALLGRRRGRDAPSLLFQRRPGGRDGPGGVLLGGRGHPADVADGRGLVVPPARQPPAGPPARRRSRTAGRCCSWPRSGSGTSSARGCSGS